MKQTTKLSWMMFSKGFLRGSLLGCGFLAIGLVSRAIAILIGLETDKSTSGMSLLPLYVLSFGLGRGAVTLLSGDAPTRIEYVIAWSAAVAIVLAGCGVMASQLNSDRPIDPYLCLCSSAILLALLIASALGRRFRSKDHA
jgi:hypothetical protein